MRSILSALIIVGLLAFAIFYIGCATETQPAKPADKFETMTDAESIKYCTGIERDVVMFDSDCTGTYAEPDLLGCALAKNFSVDAAAACDRARQWRDTCNLEFPKVCEQFRASAQWIGHVKTQVLTRAESVAACNEIMGQFFKVDVECGRVDETGSDKMAALIDGMCQNIGLLNRARTEFCLADLEQPRDCAESYPEACDGLEEAPR